MVKLVFALHLLFAIFAIGPLVHAATTAGRGVRRGDGAATAASARMLRIYSYASVLVVLAGGAAGRRHALPNAAIPVMTIVGLRVGALIGGAVVTEQVFGWPGVGLLLVNSVSQRDLAVVQTIVLMVAFAMVAVNLGIDLLYGWIDPRIRTRNRTG